MAHIEDKIAEIKDTELRQAIATEVLGLKKLLKEKRRFGLVFEGHQPELVPIFSKTVRAGLHVTRKTGKLSEIWRVIRVKDGFAELLKDADDSRDTAPVKSLVVVRRMGEAIYPALVPMGDVNRTDPAHPHHVLIEADNYHALQLLEYIYRGKADCIYIDPPYNTGARDWKYNNDYVDKNDGWRHSKWLSMMNKRLDLAVRLLKPDGVLLIAIDDYEFAHLAVLLEQIFPFFERGIIVVNHHPQGGGGSNISRTHEYMLVLTPNGQDILRGSLQNTGVEYRSFMRSGTGENNFREGRPNSFYAVLVDPETNEIKGVEPPPQGAYPIGNTANGLRRIYPQSRDGRERVWRLAYESGKGASENGGIICSPRGTIYQVIRHEGRRAPPISNWIGPKYNAGTYGANLISDILGKTGLFSYPKSLYTVYDAIQSVTFNRPHALIIDFFAGSGTTQNAVNLLNATDGGRRQCIMVTNNEVSEAEAQELGERGLHPGDEEWEAQGICQSVTWPRSKYTITGQRNDGTPLPGEYMTSRMVVKEKTRTFRQLSFIEGRNLSLQQRKQLVALIDAIPQSKLEADTPWFLDDEIHASILWDVAQTEAWLNALSDAEHVSEFYVVTRENRLFNKIKGRISEILPPLAYEEIEKRPLADGFAVNLAYFKLDFLDPNDVQMGRQFAAILPVLWMMAGSKGARPQPPGSHAPWLIPEGCPFAVLLHEARFKDFHRHIEGRDDLTHIFIVTNAREVYHKLREEIDAPHVVQLYKDYLENFKINLKQD